MRTSIQKEFSELYDKEAKTLFQMEKAEEEFQQQKRNYLKYYELCRDNLEEIDLVKIIEENKKLEGIMLEKIVDLEKMEEAIRNLLINDPNKVEINVTEKVEEMTKTTKDIREMSINTTNKLDNLENQSLDSIKKMKTDYETQNESLINNLRESIKKKEKENLILIQQRKEKTKVLEEREAIHKVNLVKVSQKENDFNQLSEKFHEANNKNQFIQEEIQSYITNINLLQNELNSLEERLKIKKCSDISKKKNLYSLQMSNEKRQDEEEVRNLQLENLKYFNEIENNKMCLEDFIGLKEKEKVNEEIVNDKRGNVLSLVGIMMNCLLMIKKKERVKLEKVSMDQDKEEFVKVKSVYEDVIINSDRLREEKEKNMKSRMKLESIRQRIRKNDIIKKKLEKF